MVAFTPKSPALKIAEKVTPKTEEVKPILAIAKPVVDLKALADQIAAVSEFTEHNLIVLQKTGTKIDDLKDERHKEFLKYIYGQMKYKKDYAFASLMKAILLQNKIFFTITKDTVKIAVQNDPDNPNKGNSFELGPICAQFAKLGIVQLWDAVKATNKDDRHVAGYVIANPELRSLLNVDNKLALEQFEELKDYASNDWFPKDLVFDSCGELRVASDDIRILIEGRRTMSSESRAMNKDVSTVATTQPVATEVVFDLETIFTEEQIAEIADAFAEAKLGGTSFSDYLENSVIPSFIDYVSQFEINETQLKESIEVLLSGKEGLPQGASLLKILLSAAKKYQLLKP